MQLAGKTILITGASGGLGAALARAFAAHGCRLLLAARRLPELEMVASDCKQIGADSVHCFVLDVGKPESIADVGQQIIALYGAPNVLVHNAGISQRGLATDTAMEVDRRIMEVNYMGMVGITKLMLPGMVARGSGTVVGISSLAGLFGFHQRSAYSASKHAMVGYIDSLGLENMRFGLSTLLVFPASVRTDMSINALRADGSPNGHMDESHSKGLDADVCAAKIVRAIERGKRNLVLARKERILLWLKKFLPSLFYKVAARLPA